MKKATAPMEKTATPHLSEGTQAMAAKASRAAQTLISWVLNNASASERAAEEPRKRIFEAWNKLRYAVKGSVQRGQTLALILPIVNREEGLKSSTYEAIEDFSARIQGCLSTAAYRKGYSLVVGHCDMKMGNLMCLRRRSGWGAGFFSLLRTTALFCLAGSACILNAGQAEYLVKDGVAKGGIFAPEKKGHATELAVDEIEEYVNKMSGAILPVQYSAHAEETAKTFREAAIILKPETIGVFSGDAASKDRFTIVQEKNHITISFAFRGWRSMRSLLLVAILGVRWFAPGADGEVVLFSRILPLSRAHVKKLLPIGIAISG